MLAASGLEEEARVYPYGVPGQRLGRSRRKRYGPQRSRGLAVGLRLAVDMLAPDVDDQL